MIQQLHQHIASSPHLSHISPQRSCFIGAWDTCPPDFQPCDGACVATPRALACTPGGGAAPAPRCPYAPQDVFNPKGTPQSPTSHPLTSFGSAEGPPGDAITRLQLASTLSSGAQLESAVRSAVSACVPQHEVAQIGLRRVQLPPRQMLKRERLPRLQAALRTLQGPHDLQGLDICNVLSGIWCGRFPRLRDTLSVRVLVPAPPPPALAHCGRSPKLC